ncbi:MAG: response regulator transcription factor [Sediminibacterium sp.]|nr:response regulator transcription factor [Sediminibacterium sp.]
MEQKSKSNSLKSKIKLIIADDHPLLRLGVINFISKNKAYQLLAETGNGRDVVKLVKNLSPDVLILDVEMPGLNGLEICKEIKDGAGNVKVLFLTMHKELDIFNKAMALGADGFLLKEHTLSELEEAINTVYQGKLYVGKELEKMLDETKSSIVHGSEVHQKIEKLTKTERTVLHLMANSFSSKEIAAKLFISEKTIKNHRHNIISKLELEGDQNCLLRFVTENAHFLK